MKRSIILTLCLTILQYTNGYSKYGRTCKDIGCLRNEECVMEEDPCSYYNREQCGTYPTCKKTGESTKSCEKFVCPPTQICQLDNGTPKCAPKESSSSNVRPVHSNNAPNAPQPDYPSAPNVPYPNAPAPGGLYPSITTPRPRVQSNYPNQGYSGSAPNSGYPGSQPNSGYPGYPSQNGYPNQGGYPGYPSQGYPNQGGYPGYPSQGGYPNQGGYPSQGGYPGYNQGSRYQPNQQQNNRNRGTNSGSNPLVDKISDQLKNIGTSFLKNALSKAIGG